MKIFLTLKHWQLFALQLGPWLVSQLLLFGTLPSGANLRFFFLLFGLGMLFFVGTSFGWMYAMATGLHRLLPAAMPMRLNRFKTALFIPVAYVSALLAYLLIGPDLGAVGGRAVVVALAIIPLHLLSMTGIFYCLYFVAKSLKAVETQRPAALANYLGELFMIWFFPIGVWIIQPRVNALFDAAPRVGVGFPNAGEADSAS